MARGLQLDEKTTPIHQMRILKLRKETPAKYKRWSPLVKCLLLLLPTGGPPSPLVPGQAMNTINIVPTQV